MLEYLIELLIDSVLQHVFIQQNLSNIQSLGAADVLIETCLQLPYLKRYISKYNTAVLKKGFSLPSSFSEAQAMRHRYFNCFIEELGELINIS